MKPKDVATRLGVKLSRIYQIMDEFPNATKPGGRDWDIPEADVIAYEQKLASQYQPRPTRRGERAARRGPRPKRVRE